MKQYYHDELSKRRKGNSCFPNWDKEYNCKKDKCHNDCDCDWHFSKHLMKKIYHEITNPTHGLVEIKSEVSVIEEAVTSPTFGLKEIKFEVTVIEEAITSTTYGLEEIVNVNIKFNKFQI